MLNIESGNPILHEVMAASSIVAARFLCHACQEQKIWRERGSLGGD